MPFPHWLRRFGYFLLAMIATVLLGLRSFNVEPVVAQAPSPFSLVQQAQSRSQRGETNTAIALLTEAAAQFAAQGDTLNQAMALGNLAALYLRVGQGPAATTALNQALNLATAQPKSPEQQRPEQQRILAQLWDVQGQQYLEQGQPQAAIDVWSQAATLYAEQDTTALWLQNQLNQARAFQSLGLYPRACQILLRSLAISPRERLANETTSCDLPETVLKTLATAAATPEQVMGMIQLANVLRVLGHLDRAAALLDIALTHTQSLGLADLTATVTLQQGNVWRAQAGQPTLTTAQRDRARQAAIAAYQETAQASQPTLGLQAQANLLSFLIATGDRTAAIALWQDLKPGLAQLPQNRTGLEIRLNLVESLLTLLASPLGRGAGGEDSAIAIADVENLIKTAVQQATTLGHDRLQAYALGNWGRLAELQGQPTGAIALTQRALALVPPFQAPEVAYPLFWQLGRLQADQGEREAAIAAYSQAIQILASLRGDLVAVNPEVQFSFREQVEPIYREFVRLLVGGAKPSQGDLQRARQVIESLQVAELDNFFQDACAETKPQSIDQLDQTAAVIYPIILPDRLTVIVSIPNQPLLHYSTAIARSDLEASLRDLRLALQPGAFPDEYVATAQSLYDLLIRPAADQLTQHQIKTLVFVLDGYLRNVPMAVLNDGEQFLVDQYNIALTPGLQLLASQPLGQTPVRTLMGGLAEGRQGFSPLPAVEGEVAEIAAQVPAAILLNQTFTRENLQTQMTSQAFPVVHLATHGQFSSQAEDTFILTWDDRISVKQLDQLLRSRTQRKQNPLELLVLSACETARGDDRAALGLAGVAVRSGARSTLATLWQVNDVSTAAFMAQFYQELTKPGMTKARALRNAQIALKQQPDFQNPFFWAPFILVGNWQ